MHSSVQLLKGVYLNSLTSSGLRWLMFANFRQMLVYSSSPDLDPNYTSEDIFMNFPPSVCFVNSVHTTFISPNVSSHSNYQCRGIKLYIFLIQDMFTIGQRWTPGTITAQAANCLSPAISHFPQAP